VLLFGTRDQSLNAVPFDLRRLEAMGTPVQVISPVQVRTEGPVSFAVSENGVAVYLAGRATDGNSIVISDDAEERTRLDIDGYTFFDVRFSPNGRLLSYANGGHLYIRDLALGTSRQLTHTAHNWGLVWINDSTFIYRSNRLDPREEEWSLFRQRLGATEPEQQYLLPLDHFPVAWTPDGRLLVYEFGDPSKPDIVVLSFEGDSVTRTPYLEAPWGEGSPALSPDRRWLVYTSDEGGEWRVYARSFPDPDTRIPISDGPGWGPLWGPTGDTIYYVVAQELRAAVLRGGDPRQVVSRRTVLTGISSGAILWRRQYDIHPQTRRLAFLAPNSTFAPAPTPTELTLVVNWFAQMRERMGAPSP
jgi:Tol biopolymer transport system component